ncbi:unnamed protein product [Caenorhabditis nigoni]
MSADPHDKAQARDLLQNLSAGVRLELQLLLNQSDQGTSVRRDTESSVPYSSSHSTTPSTTSWLSLSWNPSWAIDLLLVHAFTSSLASIFGMLYSKWSAGPNTPSEWCDASVGGHIVAASCILLHAGWTWIRKCFKRETRHGGNAPQISQSENIETAEGINLT